MTAERFEQVVGADQAGQRLDRFLADLVPNLTRTAAHRAINNGHALVDGQRAKPGLLTRVGQRVALVLPAPVPSSTQAQDIPLDIVYEDSDLAVINKPAGLVTHPARGHYDGTLVNALLAHCDDLSGIGGELRPGIVHRLDRDTSGLLVVAKNDRAHLHLARQLARRTMHRRYLALVLGVPEWETTVVDAPIGRHPTRRTEMAVTEGGRPARTAFERMVAWDQASLLAAELESGRTHQVRVHATHLGFPLLGDPVYGRAKLRSAAWLPELAEALAALPGQALHATRLVFSHPEDLRSLEFEVPPPAAFVRVAQLLAAFEPGPPAAPWLSRPGAAADN